MFAYLYVFFIIFHFLFEYYKFRLCYFSYFVCFQKKKNIFVLASCII